MASGHVKWRLAGETPLIAETTVERVVRGAARGGTGNANEAAKTQFAPFAVV